MKAEPICKTCKHVSDGATWQCTRTKDAIAGNPVSCYMERAERLVDGTVPRLPIGDQRCGPHGIHWEARNADA